MAKLLIIQQDQRIGAWLALTLRSLGFETTVASTVDEGIHWLESLLFDLVVLDAHLTPNRRREGLRVLEQLVRIQPDTPTVVLSNDGDPEVEREAWRAGANAFHHSAPLDPMAFLHDVIQLCTNSPGSRAPMGPAHAASTTPRGETQIL